MQESWVRSLGWEDPLEKGKAPPLEYSFLPGEFHSLYSPWGHKESDTTERLSLSPKHRLFHKEVKRCDKLQEVNNASGLLICTLPLSVFIVLFYF